MREILGEVVDARFVVKFFIYSLLLFTIYMVAWNHGYDVGVNTVQSEDIIRGNVICSYRNLK